MIFPMFSPIVNSQSVNSYITSFTPQEVYVQTHSGRSRLHDVTKGSDSSPRLDRGGAMPPSDT